MSEASRILKQIESGDPSAADELLPLVYDELRRLAAAKLNQEWRDQSLNATALVHEAYLRLVDCDNADHWDGRGHFFAAAATAMRRILLNRARDKARLKRGGDRQRIDLSDITVAVDTPAEILLDLDEAIEILTQQDKVAGELVQLRFFAGLSLKEAASALELSQKQAEKYWTYSRAWLLNRLQPE